jgi:hypothetical protein
MIVGMTSMELKRDSIVVILVDANWADGIKAEAYLGHPKDSSPPNLKAFAVRILDTTQQFGLVVKAIYGDQPNDNEIRLVVPWRALEAIAWRPNMERTPNEIGF